ncbi:MAG: NAD-dependent epimerase/dehydratase family protein [Betaproteobacteria bacterium]
MNSVLVTGAYGFVGAAYCAHLARAGVPYIGAVRARARDETRDEIKEVGDFVHADWAMVLENAGVDCVVHLAARAHRIEGAVAEARTAYRRENVNATDRLLEAARLAGARRFVFTSSVKVHGESTPPGVILRESDPIAPEGEYAHSKALAEERVQDFGRELGMETVTLRLPLVYGPGAKANFAELAAAVRARRVLPFGGVRNQRSLLGVSNLCAAIDAARTQQRAAGETFFVSDGEDVSTPELVRAIADAFEVRPRLWTLPPWLLLLVATLAGRRDAARRLLESFAVDSARIRRTLQWSPPLTLAEELERLAAELRRKSS